MFFIVFIGVVILDQITKYIAYIYLQPQNTIPVINNFFYLTYLEDSGIVFGKALENIWFILTVTGIIIIITLINGFRGSEILFPQKIGITLICAGAVSDIVDRVSLGYSIGFFDFEICPIFNIAGLSAFVGGIILIYIVLFRGSRKAA